MEISVDKGSFLQSLQLGVNVQKKRLQEEHKIVEQPSDSDETNIHHEGVVEERLDNLLGEQEVQEPLVPPPSLSIDFSQPDDENDTDVKFDFSGVAFTPEEEAEESEYEIDSYEEEIEEDEFDMNPDELEEEIEEDEDSFEMDMDDEEEEEFDMGMDEEEEEFEDEEEHENEEEFEDEEDEFPMDDEDEEDEFPMDDEDEEEELEDDDEMNDDDTDEDEVDEFSMNIDDEEDEDEFPMDDEEEEEFEEEEFEEEEFEEDNEFPMDDDEEEEEQDEFLMDDEEEEEEFVDEYEQDDFLMDDEEEEEEFIDEDEQDEFLMETDEEETDEEPYFDEVEIVEPPKDVKDFIPTPTPTPVPITEERVVPTLDTVTSKDTLKPTAEQDEKVDGDSKIVHERGMRIDEFIRANGKSLAVKDVLNYYSPSEVTKALNYGIIFKKKDRIII